MFSTPSPQGESEAEKLARASYEAPCGGLEWLGASWAQLCEVWPVAKTTEFRNPRTPAPASGWQYAKSIKGDDDATKKHVRCCVVGADGTQGM